MGARIAPDAANGGISRDGSGMARAFAADALAAGGNARANGAVARAPGPVARASPPKSRESCADVTGRAATRPDRGPTAMPGNCRHVFCDPVGRTDAGGNVKEPTTFRPRSKHWRARSQWRSARRWRGFILPVCVVSQLLRELLYLKLRGLPILAKNLSSG